MSVSKSEFIKLAHPLVTTNHVGKNYDHKKSCPMCKGKKTVSERDIEKSEYRNRR